MASYENVLIFTGTLDLETVKTAIGSYRESLQSLGAEIIHEDFWGLRPLAYPIDKHTTGYYIVTEYQAPTNTVARMEVLYKRDESILRFLTVSLDKFAVDYNARKRNGLIGRKQKASTEEASTEETIAAEAVVEQVTESSNPEPTTQEA